MELDEAVRVSALAVTAVKGTRLQQVDAIQLEALGAAGDRRFYVVDANGRMVNGKQFGALQSVEAAFDVQARRLALRFPDESVVEGVVEPGELIETRFFSRTREGRLVAGPWADGLSAHLGQPVRLVEVASAVDRGATAGVSLMSRGSLRRLAETAGTSAVDGRRFRMLVEVDGLDPHEEDSWVGRRVTLGEAVVRFAGHIGRCVVTTRDPESGEVTFPTLKLLARYRREPEVPTTEPIAFGIYGQVVRAGSVRVGDPVLLGDAAG